MNLNKFIETKNKTKKSKEKPYKKQEVLQYQLPNSETSYYYTDKEVNAIISNWNNFGDLYLLRRF
jgi:hypothetical protein